MGNLAKVDGGEREVGVRLHITVIYCNMEYFRELITLAIKLLVINSQIISIISIASIKSISILLMYQIVSSALIFDVII